MNNKSRGKRNGRISNAMNLKSYLLQISQISNLMKNGMEWVGFHVIINYIGRMLNNAQILMMIKRTLLIPGVCLMRPLLVTCSYCTDVVTTNIRFFETMYLFARTFSYYV